MEGFARRCCTCFCNDNGYTHCVGVRNSQLRRAALNSDKGQTRHPLAALPPFTLHLIILQNLQLNLICIHFI